MLVTNMGGGPPMLAILDRGDTVLVPNPSYPIHIYGAIIAGADVRSVRMTTGEEFFEELERAIRESIPKPKMMIFGFPSNPTGECVDIKFFEKVVALAVLMPIVASMGGNAGMQTLAVTIRSIATNELTKNNFTQNVIKEFSIGILNGIIFAFISAIVVHLWFNDLTLSLIISISMVLNMIVAGLFGILVPISLKKFNIDPAIASSVFVTTITDVIGFLSFLGVGAFFFYN